MKHHLLHWTAHMTLLVIGLLLFNVRYGYGAIIPSTFSSISANDTLNSHLLSEVNVFSSPTTSFNSDEPRVKHNHRIEITDPYEIGLWVNDKDLIGKRLQNISIHFNRKLPNGYQVQVHIYTVDANGLPSTRLNTHNLLYYKYDANWNNFYLEHDDIVIPESGLAFIIGLMGHPKELEP